MRKTIVFRALTLLFSILTFAGGGFVRINHGEVNAGHAVKPGLFLNPARAEKKKNPNR